MIEREAVGRAHYVQLCHLLTAAGVRTPRTPDALRALASRKARKTADQSVREEGFYQPTTEGDAASRGRPPKAQSQTKTPEKWSTWLTERRSVAALANKRHDVRKERGSNQSMTDNWILPWCELSQVVAGFLPSCTKSGSCRCFDQNQSSEQNNENVVLPCRAMPPRSCRVSLEGSNGTEHSVVVLAESLFEAAALGLALSGRRTRVGRAEPRPADATARRGARATRRAQV